MNNNLDNIGRKFCHEFEKGLKSGTNTIRSLGIDRSADPIEYVSRWPEFMEMNRIKARRREKARTRSRESIPKRYKHGRNVRTR